MQALNRTGEQAQELARQSSQNFTVMTEAGSILSRGFQDISQEWFGLMQGAPSEERRRVHRPRALPVDSRLHWPFKTNWLSDRLQHTIEAVRRMAAVSTRIADEATRTVAERQPTGSTRRAA